MNSRCCFSKRRNSASRASRLLWTYNCWFISAVKPVLLLEVLNKNTANTHLGFSCSPCICTCFNLCCFIVTQQNKARFRCLYLWIYEGNTTVDFTPYSLVDIHQCFTKKKHAASICRVRKYASRIWQWHFLTDLPGNASRYFRQSFKACTLLIFSMHSTSPTHFVQDLIKLRSSSSSSSSLLHPSVSSFTFEIVNSPQKSSIYTSPPPPQHIPRNKKQYVQPT